MATSPVVLVLLVFLVLLGVRGYLSDLAAGKREAAMQEEIELLRTVGLVSPSHHPTISPFHYLSHIRGNDPAPSAPSPPHPFELSRATQ